MFVVFCEVKQPDDESDIMFSDTEALFHPDETVPQTLANIS